MLSDTFSLSKFGQPEQMTPTFGKVTDRRKDRQNAIAYEPTVHKLRHAKKFPTLSRRSRQAS